MLHSKMYHIAHNGMPFDIDIRYDNPNETGRREAQFNEGWRRALEGRRPPASMRE
jgi:hypothetical protein